MNHSSSLGRTRAEFVLRNHYHSIRLFTHDFCVDELRNPRGSHESIDLVQDREIQNTFKRFNARKAGAYTLMLLLFLFGVGSLKAQTPDPTPLNAPQPGIRPPLTPFPRYEHPGWDVIAGRQEMVLGTGRLLDDNEGVNVRSAFDGFRIGYDKPKGIGGRYFNRLPGEPPRAGFDYNVETGFQWGSFGNRSIRAWGAGGNIGWTLPGPMWRMRFGLQADVQRAISARSLFRSEVRTDRAGEFWFHPLQNVTADLCWIWFWRESTNESPRHGASEVQGREEMLADLAAVSSLQKHCVRQCRSHLSVLTIASDFRQGSHSLLTASWNRNKRLDSKSQARVSRHRIVAIH